jgi:hypothetical protein
VPDFRSGDDNLHVSSRCINQRYVQPTSYFIFPPESSLSSAVYGGGANTSGVYGTVATIFLFQGSYAIGITPLTVLYPPEVLNFPIRSNGMAAWTFAVTCGG